MCLQPLSLFAFQPFCPWCWTCIPLYCHSYFCGCQEACEREGLAFHGSMATQRGGWQILASRKSSTPPACDFVDYYKCSSAAWVWECTPSGLPVAQELIRQPLQLRIERHLLLPSLWNGALAFLHHHQRPGGSGLQLASGACPNQSHARHTGGVGVLRRRQGRQGRAGQGRARWLTAAAHSALPYSVREQLSPAAARLRRTPSTYLHGMAA